MVSVRVQVAWLSLDIQHTRQNKSNRHLEQRLNRKSALGNLYIGGVRAEFLRRKILALMVLYAGLWNLKKTKIVSVRVQVAWLSLDIQHTQQNKSNRHLEQRRNRKSALGNLYIGSVRAEFLRRDTPAVETTCAAAIKGQGHRNPTGLKTTLQLLSSPWPNLAGVSFTNPHKSNVLRPPCYLPLLLLVARDLQGLLAGCSGSLWQPRHFLVQAGSVCLKSKSGIELLAKLSSTFPYS